jgi:FkbM family methyltransferase
MPYGNVKISQSDLESRRKNRGLPAPPFNHRTGDGVGYWDFKGYKDQIYKVASTGFANYDAYWSYFNDNERGIREKIIFDKLLKPGDVFMDVGAYMGSWTLAALANGVSMVYSYEIDPRWMKELELNVEINGWNDRTLIHNWGLYSENTESDWYDSEDWGQKAKFCKLDEQFPSNQLDFVKIDTEGAELHVLSGGWNTFKKFKPNMWVECHLEWDQQITDKVINHLKRIDPGYIIEAFMLDPNTRHVLASRPTLENKRYFIMRSYTLDQLIDMTAEKI